MSTVHTNEIRMKFCILGLAVFIITLFAYPESVHAQLVIVQGTVTDAKGKAMPGVTVSIVISSTQRSYPSTTDGRGVYSISSVPISATPYTLEVYWGKDLIYQQSLVVSDSMTLPIKIK